MNHDPDPTAEATSTRPVRARHAASLLLLRPGATPSLLMGVRGAGHRFMPSRLVFPGGAVDPEDYGAPVASPLTAETRLLLEKGAVPALASAIAAAAARELEEETGLSLGSPPALAGLSYLGRAVTPNNQPVRFNARFFVADAEAATGDIAGSGELEGLRWYGLEEAQALDLARPTRMVLGFLADWMALTPHERAARITAPVFRNRQLQLE